MTLQSNEVVYTADLMNIAPSNDAQIYGMSGNWILNGLSVVSSNATSITLSAGRAIIQGRLFELKANTEYAVNSQAGFIGLDIDLTQTNSEDTTGLVTNNQFTFGFGASEFGDTLQGDVNAFVGLYAVDGKGGYTQHTYKYYNKVFIDPSWEGNGFPNYNYEKPTVIREGHTVSIQGYVTNTGQINTGRERLPVRHVSEEFRPSKNIYTASTTGGILFELTMQTNGQLVLSNFSGKAIKSRSFIPIYINYMI